MYLQRQTHPEEPYISRRNTNPHIVQIHCFLQILLVVSWFNASQRPLCLHHAGSENRHTLPWQQLFFTPILFLLYFALVQESEYMYCNLSSLTQIFLDKLQHVRSWRVRSVEYECWQHKWSRKVSYLTVVFLYSTKAFFSIVSGSHRRRDNARKIVCCERWWSRSRAAS